MKAPAATCGHWIGDEQRHCGASPTRRYLQGARCSSHTPARLAGQPEPGQGRACAPNRCCCGDPECPAFSTFELRDRYTAHADYGAVVDARAIASGRRRASPEQYRAAQANVAARRTRRGES